ncbi:MAG TPA: ATP-grasp domain-containing protein [Clostridia bacterium]|nr:ATP-grasp domain-containing protein [Clostridia bacterium]
MYLLDGFSQVSPGDSPRFVDEVLNIARLERVSVIIPCSTMELENLSKASSRFAKDGIKIAVSELEGLQIANNKARLYEELLKTEVRDIVPRYERVFSPSALASISQKLGYPERKVCVKPAFGKGSRGYRVLDGSADRFVQYINEKPDSTLTTLPDLLSVVDGHQLPELLVMEYLPGDEWSVDVLAQHGQALIVIPRRRNVTSKGIAIDSTIEENKELIQLARDIVQLLGLSFCINIQFRYDMAGKPKVLEINPRVSGTIVAATAAGVNLPYLCVKLCLGEEFEVPTPQWGTRLLRYWEDIAIDAEGRRISY